MVKFKLVLGVCISVLPCWVFFSMMFACTVNRKKTFLLFFQKASVLPDRVNIFPDFSPEFKEPVRDCVMMLERFFILPFCHTRALTQALCSLNIFFKLHNVIFLLSSYTGSAFTINFSSSLRMSFHLYGKRENEGKNPLLWVKKVMFQGNISCN